MFQRTTAVNKLLALNKRKKVVQGGTWAGKSYGIVAVLINDLICNPSESLTVVAETIPALKRGTLADFKQIMYHTNRWIEGSYNATDRIYHFTNGSTIEFNSFDSVGKAQAAGKRTKLFLNEAYYISFEIADALIGRTSGDVWIDFNPVSEFWAHTEIVPQEETEFLILKPKDNEALPETIKQDHRIKRKKAETSSYWANWCRVYLDGEVGAIDGLIYPEWEYTDKFPECKWQCLGLDFGYTNDPTALVRVGLSEGEIYLDELIYETGLTNQDILKRFEALSISRSIEVFADSAEPKSIEEIRRGGYFIKPCEKGRDSVINGINKVKQYKLNVTKSSVNLIKELRNYKWMEKGDKVLNKPVDDWNHLLDAVRYALTMKTANKGRVMRVGSIR